MLCGARRRGLRALAGALSGEGAAWGGSVAAAAAAIPLLPLAGPSAQGRERALSAAAAALRAGGLVAVPTDTVYGIACLAQDSRALRAVYRLKGRHGAKPLAICLADVAQVHRYCKVAVPDQLLHDLLPGPVTLVLERSQTLNPDLNPFTPLVGVRVPSHWFVRELARACAAPLALTSANISAQASSLAVTEFQELWPHLALVVDGGPIGDLQKAEGRLGSTVVDISVPGKFKVIRPGCALTQTVEILVKKHGLTADSLDPMASDDLPLPPTLRCSLQKCFRALQDQHETWKSALTSCTSLLSSLSNLAEQMQASQKVAFANTPLRDFPALPGRLRCRQQSAAEALLEELWGKLLELQKVRDAAGTRIASIFQLCEQQEGLYPERAFQRSVLCPSLADMLEWLLDVEGFYHSICLEVKMLLLQVTYEDLPKMQTLSQAWEQVLQHGLQSVVKGAVLKVSFFLEAG